jgi:hypothetical protein
MQHQELTHRAVTAQQTRCQPQSPHMSWAQQQMSASPCGCLQLPAGCQNRPYNAPPSAPRQLQGRRTQDDEHVTSPTTGNSSLEQHVHPGSFQTVYTCIWVDRSLTMLLLRRLRLCEHRGGACIVCIVSGHVCMQRMDLHSRGC